MSEVNELINHNNSFYYMQAQLQCSSFVTGSAINFMEGQAFSPRTQTSFYKPLVIGKI